MNKKELNNQLNILENRHHILRIKEGDLLAGQKKFGKTKETEKKLKQIYTEMNTIELEMITIKSQIENE
jgi:hypothetical protein